MDESIDKRNLLQEYVHVVMEAQKPLDLLSASGTSRKAGRIIQSKSKCLRTRVAKGVCKSKSKILRLNEENKFAISLPFCSISALNRLDDAHLQWEGRSS